MKRNDMVTLIQKELEEDDLTGKNLRWVAQHILSICEKAGMLPPIPNGGYGPKRQASGGHQWEDENE